MKKLILPFALLFSAYTISNAQLQAGVLGNLEYQSLLVDIQMLDNPIDNYEEMYKTVDLDGDGTDDITYQAILANVPDFQGSIADLHILNPHVELMYDSMFYSRLEIGEVISDDSSWVNSFNWSLAYHFYGIAGLTTGGNWLPEAQGYVAFRIDQGTDTLYGWIDLFVSSSEEMVIIQSPGYAIGKFISSSVEQVYESLDVFPNPTADWIYFEKENISRIQVFDITGRLVLEKTKEAIQELNIASLPSGNYQLFTYSQNNVYLNRIVKR